MNAKTTRKTGRHERHESRKSRAGALVKWALVALAALFAADALYNPEKFRIKAVELHGSFERIDAAQVERAVAGALPGNYFLTDTEAVEERIAALPWAYRAAVRRKWPDTLVVAVTEAQPVARWGAEQWMHANGDLAGRLPGAEELLPRLPKLSGPDGSRHAVWGAYKKWSEVFAANGLALDSLRFDSRGLWHMQLSLSALARQAGEAQNAPVGVVVRHEYADARITRFARTMPRRLISHFPEMRGIDLRYPNGFAVSWREGARARMKRAINSAGGASAW